MLLTIEAPKTATEAARPPMPPVKTAARLAAERVTLQRRRGETTPVTELEIFTTTPDRIMQREDDGVRQLFLCALRQAWVDARWTDNWEGTPIPGNWRGLPTARRDRERLERIYCRQDKVWFWSGAIDTSPDCDDIGFGESGQLLTLRLICEILDLDHDTIQAEARRRLLALSPAHAALWEEYRAIAVAQEAQAGKGKKVPVSR